MIETVPKIAIELNWARGDILMATPIVRKIFLDRKGKCSIDFFTHEWSAPVLENNQYIANVVTADFDKADLTKYDMVLNLDLAYGVNPRMHPTDAYGFWAFGHNGFDKRIDLFSTEQDRKAAQDFKNSVNEKYVVLHIRNGIGPCRNIPLSVWQPIVEHILANSTCKIVCIGTKHDSYFVGDSRIIDAREKFSFPVLKEVIGLADVFVGADSGPAIVASATDTNMVVLYTDVFSEYRKPHRALGRYVPFEANIECKGCRATQEKPVVNDFCKRGDIECINRFDPIDIGKTVIKLLE